jgi:dTDP-glucose 4,6-dehydratase
VLCEKIGELQGKDKNYYKKLITFVKDRPGHDRRYAINCNKLKKELGWKQSYSFQGGLNQTINWYITNKDWVERVRSGEYKEWIDKNYESR